MPLHRAIAVMISLVLVLSACQTSQPTSQAATSTVEPSPEPVSLPSATTEPTAAPTIPTPEPVALAPTSAPATPACFVTSDVLAAFFLDRERILLRGAAGAQIVDLRTLKEEEMFTGPANATPAVALSPDGAVLAWVLEDNTIQLLRIGDKKVLGKLQGHTGPITQLEFSPDGYRLYSASHDTWVRVWDLKGKQVGAFQPTGADNLPNEVLGLGISPDGKLLATLPFDGPVKIWRTKDFKLVRELGASGGYDTSDVVFSPDDQFVAADAATGLFLWRAADATQLLGGNPGINSMAVAFSSDGKYLAYAAIDENNAIILASPDGSREIRRLKGDASPVWDLVFSPDGSLLASIGSIGLGIWRVEDGSMLYIGKSECS